MSPIRTVHLVAKTHLDLGFTALAAEVEARYLREFFPRAIEAAAALRERRGPERLVWTTGSWILDRALHDGDPERAAAVAAAVQRGDLAWHALPLTFHTELLDRPLLETGLAISAELDERFDRTTTAAKMTDVPGHTRGIVAPLAAAGVTFLHVGVNPAWPVPEVPPVFRWRANDGAEVTVAYQAGGYGGEVVVDGCPDALAFLHAGDNLGPPSAAEVLDAHAELARRHPRAEVRASTLDEFARALAASGAVEALPVVTAEIGDPWLFGAGSDPQKVSAFRRLLARRRSRDGDRPSIAELSTVDRRLLLVAEHTWGLDQKAVLPTEVEWDDASLATLRLAPAGKRFDASWREQRRYVDEAELLLGRRPVGLGGPPRPAGGRDQLRLGPDGSCSALDGRCGWRLALDPSTGGLRELVHTGSGRSLADDDHQLGVLSHQTFSEADYARFLGQLTPAPDDEWWAVRDNSKPGIDGAGAVSTRVGAEVVDAWVETDAPDRVELLVVLRYPEGRVGAPRSAWIRWRVVADTTSITCEVGWIDKPATRLPEASWCSFVPVVAEPQRWLIDKLGEWVSPLDVVRRGGRSLHAVGTALRYEGADGALAIRPIDAPLVAPGRPNLLDADPPLPDLEGGWHALLHDNCWGTNFPMWNEGDAAFTFEIELDPSV